MSHDQPLSRRDLLAGTAAAAAWAAAGGAAFAEEAAPAPRRRIETMPAAFVSHGSPMLGVDRARGPALTRWTAGLPQPVAVLSVSAHYERRPVTIGATKTLPLVYDFRGFPKALYKIEYAAPGAPKLARRVQQQLAPIMRVQQQSRRGHDHGTWVPMRWMYPKADVPLLSVSLPSHDPKTLYRLGRALRPLRDEGVLIVGSGSMTHNLRRMGRAGSATPGWAQEFDDWSQRVLVGNDVDGLLDWQKKAPAARTNHPTVEHFVPLILAAGARKDGEVATFPITGFQNGSMSRRSVSFDRPKPKPKPKAG